MSLFSASWPTWAERLGLPPLRGRGRLVSALAVDSIGTGLFLPFGVIFFLHTTSLSLAAIGAGLSMARLLSLATPIAAGYLIDRFGARRVFALGDLLGALGFVGFMLVSSIWELIAAAFVVSAGQATFWTASRTLVGEITAPEERRSWFALHGMTRNAGFGLGGLAAAAFVSVGSRWVYLAFAAVNATSFVITAAMVLSWRQPGGVTSGADAPAGRGTDAPAGRGTGSLAGRGTGSLAGRSRTGALLTDRALLLITGVNFAFVMCDNVLSVLLVVYVTTVLRESAWLGALAFTVNTLLVSLAQGIVTKRAKHFSHSAALELAAVCWALSFVLLWGLDAAPPWLLVPGLIVAVVVFSVAEMLKEPVINTMLTDIAPAGASGRYAAAYQLSWSIGRASGPFVLIALLARGVVWVWLVMLAMCALGGLSVRRVGVKRGSSASLPIPALIPVSGEGSDDV